MTTEAMTRKWSPASCCPIIPRPLLAAAAMALALSACGGEEQSQGAPPPPEVGVVQVRPGTVPLQKDLVGRLAAFRSADVRARVPGVLERRVYEEGTDVKAGQVLFRIDPSQLQAELGQAQAALASAEANYANAKVAADRARRLAPAKFISQSDLDNALAAERSASAAVKQADAALANARINLGYATVRSPIDGRAGKQQVTEGALVGEGRGNVADDGRPDRSAVRELLAGRDRTRAGPSRHGRASGGRGRGAGDPARRHPVRAPRQAGLLRRRGRSQRPARSRCARASRIRTGPCCPALT